MRNGLAAVAVGIASIRAAWRASRAAGGTSRVKPAELTRMSARPNVSPTAAATAPICALTAIENSAKRAALLRSIVIAQRCIGMRTIRPFWTRMFNG